MPNAVHTRGGIPHAVSYIGRELYADVSAGAALPPDVSQKLLRIERLLGRNILNEQPQHPFAVFAFFVWGMPFTRKSGSNAKTFGLLLVVAAPSRLVHNR